MRVDGDLEREPGKMIDAQHPGLRQFCLILRIIVAAVGFGPVVFLAVVHFVASVAKPEGTIGDPVFAVMFGIFLMGALVAWTVAPPVILRNARRQVLRGAAGPTQLPPPLANLFSEEEGPMLRLLMAYQVATIVRIAIIEGVAFFSIILYMIQGAPIYAGAALALIVLVLLHFPSPERIAGWLERQQRQIEDERMLGLDR
jgi:hypothetical protein